MTEHKTDMNITKIEKCKTLDMTEHKADMNITEIHKYKKTEQHIYNGTQNRIQLHFGEPSNKPPLKWLTKIFNQHLKSIHFLCL